MVHSTHSLLQTQHPPPQQRQQEQAARLVLQVDHGQPQTLLLTTVLLPQHSRCVRPASCAMLTAWEHAATTSGQTSLHMCAV